MKFENLSLFVENFEFDICVKSLENIHLTIRFSNYVAILIFLKEVVALGYN